MSRARGILFLSRPEISKYAHVFLLWFWKQAQKQFRKDVGRSVPDSSLKSIIAMPKIARIASVFPLNSGLFEMYLLYTPAQFSSQELWTAQNNVQSIIVVAQNYSSNSCNSWCFGWRRGTESEMWMHFSIRRHQFSAVFSESASVCKHLKSVYIVPCGCHSFIWLVSCLFCCLYSCRTCVFVYSVPGVAILLPLIFFSNCKELSMKTWSQMTTCIT